MVRYLRGYDADFNGILVLWAPEAHVALAHHTLRLGEEAHEDVAYTAEGKTNERGRENFGEWWEH